jgi:hypothetical protein
VLTFPQAGVTNTALYTVSGASAQVSLTSPNAALGVGNDSLSLAWSGLPVSPVGTRYVVYGSNGTNPYRLGSFEANNTSGTFTFNATAPANGGTPGTTIVDARGNYTRIFVTLEPFSSGDAGFASSQPGPSVVLDSTPGSWMQSIPLTPGH